MSIMKKRVRTRQQCPRCATRLIRYVMEIISSKVYWFKCRGCGFSMTASTTTPLRLSGERTPDGHLLSGFKEESTNKED